MLWNHTRRPIRLRSSDAGIRHMIKTTNFRISRLRKIQPLLQLNLLNSSAILAGGSLQTLVDSTIPINDYDLFFTDEAVAQLTKRRLKIIGELVFECPQGTLTTFKVK